MITIDGIDRSRIAVWINEIRGTAESQPPPFDVRRDRCRLRFNVMLGLVPTWREELADLAGRMLLLME